MEKQLNRRERRALIYAESRPSVEHAAALESAKCKEEANKPIFVVEVQPDGWIVIPTFTREDSPGHTVPVWFQSDLAFMLPEDKVQDFYVGIMVSTQDNGSGNTIKAYSCMLRTWFFGGLQSLELTFKPNVRTVSGDITQKALHSALVQYVGTLLQSFEPSHEHKFAYLTYVMDMCCSQISWVKK